MNQFAYVLLLLTLACTPALAETVTPVLAWDAPVVREDGTPLAASEIAGYRIYMAIDSAVATDPDASYITVTGALTRTITVELTPRAEPYTLRFGARCVDTEARASQLSTIVEGRFRVRSSAGPGAPTTLRINFACPNGNCTATVVE